LSKNGEKEWLLLERVLGGGTKLWKQARGNGAEGVRFWVLWVLPPFREV